jgi:serine protease Do
MPTVGFGEVAERVRRSTVEVRSGRLGSGSGVVWSTDGRIITNAHVVHSSAPAVILWDGTSLASTIISRDSHRDLAQLQISGQQQPLPVRDSSTLKAGELLLAVGNPLGFTGALSTGVVHRVGSFEPLGRRDWVQADIRLAPGNSGGPLVDAAGQLVGINTMITRGLALAIPSNSVKRFVAAGAGPELGVVVRPVRASVDGGTSLGLLVLETKPDGAAQRASLLPGDILIGAADQKFRSVDDLAVALEDAAASPLVIRFLRGGSPATRKVAVALKAGAAEAA